MKQPEPTISAVYDEIRRRCRFDELPLAQRHIARLGFVAGVKWFSAALAHGRLKEHPEQLMVEAEQAFRAALEEFQTVFEREH